MIWRGHKKVSLALSLDSRGAVDAMSAATAANGGIAGINPVRNLGFMYGRDPIDPDGHVWGSMWMDPSAMPFGEAKRDGGH